jgi:hypothetical protein
MIGGLIIEFISGVVFYLYFRCASQLSSFCVCVERMSRFLLANKMCDQFIGKYLSRLRKLDHAIVLKVGFES